MLRILSVLAFVVFSGQVIAQKITYQLKMEKPQNHYFQVEMQLDGFSEKELEIKMPVWAPGSYLVREFAKNVNQVKATDESGKLLQVVKKTKNTWSIAKGSAKKIIVNYEVYAFELSVRTSFLDLTHGFVSGSGVFMYVNNHKDLKGKLEVVPYSGFSKVSTALPYTGLSVSGDGKQVFEFADYDQLVDSPIEIGNQKVFEFDAAGVKHTVAIYGVGNYDVERLKTDMAKVVETATAVMGENPNLNYLFIIHNVVDGQGGLEHKNSCTLSVNRWTFEGSEYTGFLSLVAHEYFHLWNVKRIRPVELGPFNYDAENYTTLLWVMEGFTSYYEKIILLRAGYLSQEEYLNKLQGTVNYVEGSVGSRVQPVADASFDAWIKAYRPNENSANTTMTYYSRGQMLGALFDAKIIVKTNGEKCLDHFMQLLYQKYAKKLNRGFSEAEFKQELETFLAENLDDFFTRYIHGTEITPLDEIFSKVGVHVETMESQLPSFGASLSQSGGKVIVKNIRSGSAAETAGVSVNDEIIGYNGYRADQAALENFFFRLNEGDEFELLVAREELLIPLKGRMTVYTKPQYRFDVANDYETSQLRNYWLRKL